MAKRYGPLPISSVNHVSLLCSAVEKSVAFYEGVLGFIPIKRPGSFDFDGAWLFNYGMGIHLIQAPNPTQLARKAEINPKDNHISFQTGCQGIEEVEEHLKELGVKYVKWQVKEGGVLVDQIFFHDPDGFMIEVCTCDNLPLVPLHQYDTTTAAATITTTTTVNLLQQPQPASPRCTALKSPAAAAAAPTTLCWQKSRHLAPTATTARAANSHV